MTNLSRLFLLLLTLVANTVAAATALLSDQCEPLVETQRPPQAIPYDKGLLWRISKTGEELGYVFGTIHVSDKEITTLPEPVRKALRSADQFAMEALPDAEQMMLLSKMMFFHDGRLLSDFIDDALFARTQQILARYKLGPDAVSVMKPWAAFLMMNYPPDTGEPLDYVLLSIAREQGADVNGLESLEEQGQIFNQLALDDQVKLLTDTVCHYEVVEMDFTIMKELYLEQDLGALYNHVHRYETMEEPLYQNLMQRLINERNHAMVERMQLILDKGTSFIAIGAMHLAGEKGVLALLEERGYEVSVIF